MFGRSVFMVPYPIYLRKWQNIGIFRGTMFHFYHWLVDLQSIFPFSTVKHFPSKVWFCFPVTLFIFMKIWPQRKALIKHTAPKNFGYFISNLSIIGEKGLRCGLSSKTYTQSHPKSPKTQKLKKQNKKNPLQNKCTASATLEKNDLVCIRVIFWFKSLFASGRIPTIIKTLSCKTQ